MERQQHNQMETEEDREPTKRPAESCLQSLEADAQSVRTIKKIKPTYNFISPFLYNYSDLSSGSAPTKMVEGPYVESKNKNRYYLTPINHEHFIEPHESLLRIRKMGDLSVVREIKGDETCSTISVCRMVPDKSSAIIGDERGCIHYADLMEGVCQIIQFPHKRGGILDICFINETKFLTVSQQRQTSVNELKGRTIINIAEKFQQSQCIKKITLLSSNMFATADSCHSIKIFDLEQLRVRRKIITDGSVYAMSRQNSNLFSYGGSNNSITTYDLRTCRSIVTYSTQQNWTGMIRHLTDFSMVFSDWRTFVLTDSRKGIISRFTSACKSGIWDGHCLSSEEMIASSSDSKIIKLQIVY